MNNKNKLTFAELCDVLYKHNKEHDITSQYADPNPLYPVVVISQKSFKKKYSLKSRSYRFRSDEKHFIPDMCGSSIFAESLDGTDRCRLDCYLERGADQWIVDYCYISKPKMKGGE